MCLRGIRELFLLVTPIKVPTKHFGLTQNRIHNYPIKMTSVLNYHMTSVLAIARPRQYICILSVKNSNEIQWGKTPTPTHTHAHTHKHTHTHKSHKHTHTQVRVITVFTVFQLLTDFVCFYNYEF